MSAETTPICSTTVHPRRTSNHADYHPLETIRFFRRFHPSATRDVIYTLIWNCTLGVAFYLIGVVFGPRGAADLENLVWNLIVANVIGYCIHGFFELGGMLGLDRRAQAAGNVMKTLYYAGVSTLGVFVGFALVGWGADQRIFAFMLNPRWLLAVGFICLLISVILSTIFFARERQARAEADLERERLRAERVEREATLATLRALQAQIEPHFLFNTLANVASLIDSDPAQSKRMLERFIRFLRASLAATREESTTLGAEGELIGAYLDVLQVRMGARLRYGIEIDPALAAFQLPPMLLQPVVENAIRHGLEPKVDGGEVRLRARREEGQVTVEIADTGIGFAPTTRGGVGLTNLRDRLKLLYGERASLTIGEDRGGGTLVRLGIPA